MILGLDLSLRAAGLALAPLDWAPGLHWQRIVVRTVGAKLPDDATELQKVKRIAGIANTIVDFAVARGVTFAWFEQYAYNAKDSRQHALGELGGVVKLRLFDAGIPFDTVPASTARAHLGRFSAPRRGPDGKKPKGPSLKEQVHAALREMGAPADWTPDECDAFVAVNHALIQGNHGGITVHREASPRAKTRRSL
jgi:hypothetical protein